jgi:hypothetical protein
MILKTTRPRIFPTTAAVKEMSMTREQTLQGESANECQCQPYQPSEAARAIARNFAAMAHPQLSPRTRRVILARGLKVDGKVIYSPSRTDCSTHSEAESQLRANTPIPLPTAFTTFCIAAQNGHVKRQRRYAVGNHFQRILSWLKIRRNRHIRGDDGTAGRDTHRRNRVA